MNARAPAPGVRTVLGLFMAGRRRLLLGGAALAALTVMAGMGLLGLAGWFLAATALAGASAATALAFDVFVPGAAIRLLALLRTAGRYGERLVTHDAALAVLAALRPRLFLGWARPEAARRLLARPARMLFRLTADVDALDALYLRLLVPAATALAACLAAGIALALLWPPLGAGVLFGLLAGGSAIVAWTARRTRNAARQRAHALETLRSQAIDLVSGQAELAMTGQLPAQCERLLRTDGRLAQADDRLHRADAAGAFAQAMLHALAMAGTLLACTWLARGGHLSAPLAALALLLVLAAAEPLTPLRRGALELARTLLAVRRLAPRLAAGDPAPATAASLLPAPVELRAVCLGHAPGGPAPGISLSIAPGERVAIVGPSGAGKTTLLATLAGERRPPAGTVCAPAACLLTQRTELFQDSVRDNLRLAAPAADDERLWQALRAAGLAGHIATLPGGLSTRLGEGGLGLSGGQARRLALARLLLRPAALWLLDEPTEGLDAATARDVLARLAAHADGRTLVIATHVRREAALADRLLVLAAGTLAADLARGTPAFDRQLNALRPD